jgi:hypothetical protein
MKGDLFLNNYLDPIAKVWGNVKPELPRSQIKIATKKVGSRRLKKRLPK